MNTRFKRLRVAALLPPALLAAGCGNMSGLGGSTEYGCKAPIGVKCDSVSGNYYNAIAGNLPSQRQERTEAPAASAPTGATKLAPRHEPRPDLLPTSAMPADLQAAAGPGQAAPLLSGPRVLRMWVKAWETSDNDLYGDSLIYIQVSGGRWLVDHVQRQVRDNFAPVRAPRAALDPKAGAVPAAASDASARPGQNNQGSNGATPTSQAPRAFQPAQVPATTTE